MRRTIMVLVAACIGVACASPMMSELGDAMVDTGTVLRDAFGSDAAAQARSFDVPCVSVEDRQLTVYSDGREQEARHARWTASVDVPGLEVSTVRGAHAVLCDLVAETTVLPESPACPDGATCSGTPSTQPELRCTFTGVQIEDGRVLAQCGLDQFSRQRRADGTETSFSFIRHYTVARIVVE